MKMTKKVFSAIVATALAAVTAIPVMPQVTVEAAASPIAAYDFENGTGMSSSGIAGSTEPTVVQDAERGNVLKLADGTSSRLINKNDDSSLGDYDLKIDKGTPSSLKFANPFAGKSLSGATISFWVKVPDNNAATIASGLIGFTSGSKTVVHPDKIWIDPATGKVDPAKQGLEDAHGPYTFGITCAYADPMSDTENPMVYFAGLHHNTYSITDAEGVFVGQGGKWQYVTVTMNNSYGKVYVNGSALELDEYKNKRWNDGEANGGTQGNVGQFKFLEFLSWADTEAYIGYTGFSPTSEVYLDDITFYASELSAAEVASLYQTAKTGSTTAGVTNSGSSASSDAAAEAKKKAAEEAAAAAAAAEAAAVEANKNLTNAVVASVEVFGMPSSATKTVTPIFRGEEAYTSVVSAVNGVVLKDGYRVNNVVAMDISYGGTQPETTAKISVDVPSGFDTNNLVVARINDDGTVSVLKHTIENGKIIAKTNHFTKYAIINLEAGKPGTSSTNLPKTGAIATGTVVVAGAVSALGGTALLKRRKKDEE